jgi:flagella basal body P-ring formation protein FlgA
MNKLLLFLFIFFLPFGAVLAGEEEKRGAMLRKQITVNGDIVTLGDIFQNSGLKADVAVFRSPKIGSSGMVSVSRIAEAARRNGLEWYNPWPVNRISVSRPSRTVSVDEIKSIIAAKVMEVRELASADNLDIRLGGKVKPIQIDANNHDDIIVRKFSFSPRSNAFRAVLATDSGALMPQEYVYSGQAVESIEVVMPRVNIDRDRTIIAQDLQLTKIPKTRANASWLANVSDVVGMAARRPLAAGRAIRADDIERPKIIRKNTLVSIVYQVPGLYLRTQGTALSDAAKGEQVSVRNNQSKRILNATAYAHGMVMVAPGGGVALQQNVRAHTGSGAVR